MKIELETNDSCKFCGAQWAAATVVNAALDAEAIKQVATPRRVYQCGTTLHPDDHIAYEVPEQDYQSPECVKAELAKHRAKV